MVRQFLVWAGFHLRLRSPLLLIVWVGNMDASISGALYRADPAHFTWHRRADYRKRHWCWRLPDVCPTRDQLRGWPQLIGRTARLMLAVSIMRRCYLDRAVFRFRRLSGANSPLLLGSLAALCAYLVRFIAVAYRP
jgi:hypothetical protein